MEEQPTDDPSIAKIINKPLNQNFRHLSRGKSYKQYAINNKINEYF